MSERTGRPDIGAARGALHSEPPLEHAPSGSLAEVHRSLAWMAVWVARAPAHLDVAPVGRRVRFSVPTGRDASTIRSDAYAAVSAYVLALRNDDVPPQRMLVLVKQATRESAQELLDGAELMLLLDMVVRWSIRAYYDGPASAL